MSSIRALSFAPVALGLAIAFAAPTSDAKPACSPTSKLAVDVWNKFGEKLKEQGCKDAKEVEQCMKQADKVEAAAKKTIAWINEQANGGWATIGPRPLTFGSKLDGRIKLGLERAFVTPGPVTETDEIEVEIVKEGDAPGGAEITIAKSKPSGACAEGGSVSFGTGKKGETKKLSMKGVRGYVVTVLVDAKGLGDFNYYLRVNKK